jgi:ribonuclease-3
VQQALTHRSFTYENGNRNEAFDNERLEFIGDVILEYIVSEYLYRRFPRVDEGILTSLRASLVRREALASYARKLDLGKQLRISIQEDQAGARDRDVILANAFEAVVGALYFDQGLLSTQTWVLQFVEPETERVFDQRLDRNPKSELQEIVQREWPVPPEYHLIESLGPEHAPQFVVAVWVSGQEYGRGQGASKRQAEQSAAQAALEQWSRRLSCERAHGLFESALEAEASGELIGQMFPELRLHLDYCAKCRADFQAERVGLAD